MITPDIEAEAVAIRAGGAFTPRRGKESLTESERAWLRRRVCGRSGQSFDDVRPL